ncbi:MAG: hypothetical protein ACK4UO_16705 [Pseudolabrys sp.]
MANDPLAQATEQGSPSEDEYDAFHAALSGSARGRAFLAEHGRRQRLADTEMLLGAVQRLEEQVAAAGTPPQEAAGEDLGVVLEAIRMLHDDLDTADIAGRMARLTAEVESLRARLDDLAAAPPAPSAPQATAAEAPASGTMPAPAAEAGHPAAPAGIPDVSWFDTLPAAEDGERPTAGKAAAPTPASPTEPPVLAVAFVAEVAEREAAAAAERKQTAEIDEVTVFKAGSIPVPEPFAGEDFSAAPAVKTVPKTDLLDSIMALSEDERTALFT